MEVFFWAIGHLGIDAVVVCAQLTDSRFVDYAKNLVAEYSRPCEGMSSDIAQRTVLPASVMNGLQSGHQYLGAVDRAYQDLAPQIVGIGPYNDDAIRRVVLSEVVPGAYHAFCP
ncbi:hypothetical protein [Nocardia fluminea]|uniref:hypothetical protein n=1 Tax=Nocardia fluminea TaxID=134984 RepID=UPI003649C913